MNKCKKPDSNDWRIQGQEEYLMGVTLIYSNYKPYSVEWDHDHCEFCGNKFSLNNEDLHEGYSTLDYYRWICKTCFCDFKDEFNWKIQYQE